MTVAEALRAATERLSATSDTARLDAELLMAHVLDCSRSDMLLSHMRKRLPDAFDALVERRAAYEPVAYLLGSQEFYGREFAVRPGVLIPRGDSETIVEAALAAAPGARSVLDLGTGSGALLLSVLAERPEARGIGIDAARIAAETARANAAALGLADRAEIREASWLEPGWAQHIPPADLVLCNPPYVESHAALDPDVRDFEPGEALFAGLEGLDDYHAIIPQLDGLLSADGVAIFEIGHTQAETVGKIARDDGFTCDLVRDLAGRPRGLVMRRFA